MNNANLRSGCLCHPYAGPIGCSWERFVATLPPDDPVRLQHEAGEPLDWIDGRWTGEPCRCDCHDGDCL